MNLLLHILAAWLLVDVILLALWVYAAEIRGRVNDDDAQRDFLDAWEVRHV